MLSPYSFVDKKFIGSHLKNLMLEEGIVVEHSEDIVSKILCDAPQPDCYLEKCKKCPGSAALRNLLLEVFEKHQVNNVSYKKWVSQPRTSLEIIQQSTKEFVTDFVQSAGPFMRHVFISKEQDRFYRERIDNLQNDECVVVCDFAENYAFVIQNAAPGFHWNNNQATVFPVVIYYKTDEDLEHKSLVFISDCLHHDSVAVYAFLRETIKFVSTLSCDIKKFKFFSDGAPQQFKNYKHFCNIYNFKNDFKVEVEWHFFASAHGKGPCDGVGGTLKRQATRVSLQKKGQLIRTPIELYNWASKSTSLPSMAFKYVNNAVYEETKIFLQPRFEKAEPIKDTQKLHCIIPSSNDRVYVKEYSFSEHSKLFSIVKEVPKKRRVSKTRNLKKKVLKKDNCPQKREDLEK